MGRSRTTSWVVARYPRRSTAVPRQRPQDAARTTACGSFAAAAATATSCGTNYTYECVGHRRRLSVDDGGSTCEGRGPPCHRRRGTARFFQRAIRVEIGASKGSAAKARAASTRDIDEDPPSPPCRLKTNVEIYNAEIDQRGRHAIDDTESAEASLKTSVGEEIDDNGTSRIAKGLTANNFPLATDRQHKCCLVCDFAGSCERHAVCTSCRSICGLIGLNDPIYDGGSASRQSTPCRANLCTARLCKGISDTDLSILRPPKLSLTTNSTPTTDGTQGPGT